MADDKEAEKLAKEAVKAKEGIDKLKEIGKNAIVKAAHERETNPGSKN